MLRQLVCGGTAATLLMCGQLVPAESATRAERQRRADQLVSEALHREIYGAQTERDELLEAARKLTPQSAEVMWHRGYVRFQKKWVKADDVAELIADDLRYAGYLRVRAEQPLTVAGQLEVANWCRESGLKDQERAHLTRVLDLNADHAETRARLGFRRLNNNWVTIRQVEEARRQLNSEQQALAVWRPRLVKLRADLNHRSQFRRDAAADRLRKINDPEAIPALEMVLSNGSDETTLQVVRAVADMADPRGAMSLVRHAVFSASETVRDEASLQLRKQSDESYVPALLSAIYTPVTSRLQVARGSGGEILYRHSFLREGQDSRQLMVLDTEFSRVALPNGDRDETLSRAANQLMATALQRERAVERQNRLTSQLNERICRVLNIATGQELDAKPSDWWQWWNEENEVFVASDKGLETIHRSEQVALADQGRPTGGGDTGGGSSGAPVQTMDCLAPGTRVRTAGGMVPIEQIQVGDLVLAQDAETGELAYKPVLQTTLRPAGQLVKVAAGDEVFECSGGHLFWVSGEGWVKARQLQSGMEVHTSNGTVQVRQLDEGRFMQTHNLVVDDFNSYFVGAAQLLSHDNTIRRVTTTVVPGLRDR